MNKQQKVNLLAMGGSTLYWILWWLALCFLDRGVIEALVCIFGLLIGAVITLFSMFWSWDDGGVESWVESKFESLVDWINKEEE